MKKLSKEDVKRKRLKILTNTQWEFMACFVGFTHVLNKKETQKWSFT